MATGIGGKFSKKRKFVAKWFLKHVYRPSKFPFLEGNSHDHFFKKFDSKMNFELHMLAIKIIFFGNFCGKNLP